MEWIDRLNCAVNYIEENIKEPINLEEVSKIACCSTYHFQRMFAYIADITLSEYIRRRRMSLAAVDLQDGCEKVIDISLKYGYDSPTAFNRAFKSVHGIAPSKAREEGTILKAFPPISFKITIKGDSEMNYRIEQKEAFRIVGVSEPLETEIEKNFEIVPKMWGKAAVNGTIPKLVAMMGEAPLGLLGVSSCNELDNWRYYIAVASNQPIEDDLEEYIVPSSTWAIFSGEGSNQSIQVLEKRIITEWLPTSGYEYGNATVKSVQNYVKLSEDEIVKVLNNNQGKLNLSKKQQERWHKKCMCLVEFENVNEINPLDFQHQGNMDDWLILEKIEDVVVGTSIPYNYEKARF